MDVEITGIDRLGIDKAEVEQLARMRLSTRRGGAINGGVPFNGDDISNDRTDGHITATVYHLRGYLF